ncbi:hypothetical protein O0I10_008375 [Lichtheimia ornata]|uniref:Uncharacterized protein n=1 Tax=Lichtheimia ornata TaxID=688661 RepID=A0AAD7V0G7_9FUNG|nr:uncharacterized protein O0I10_008375 [Lichtheimia ornata]KAJ8655935.1 hypothetical protein O0I10_008375 [Lichtheimia ornata]
MPAHPPPAGGGIERTRKTSLTKRASTKVRHLLQRNKTRGKSNSISRVEESPATTTTTAERVITNKTDTSAESISTGHSSGNYSDHDNNTQPQQSTTFTTTTTTTTRSINSEKEKSSPSLTSSEEKEEAHDPEKTQHDNQKEPDESAVLTPEPNPAASSSSSSSSPAAMAGPMSTSIVMVDLERDEDGGAEPIMNSHANLAEQETYDTTATTHHATTTTSNNNNNTNVVVEPPSPTQPPLVAYDLKQIEDITEATSRVVSSDEEVEEEEEEEESSSSRAVVVRQVAYDVVVHRHTERTNIVRTLSSLRTMGYNWPVAFSAALIIHLGIPFRLHWHSLAGWIQSHGRYRDTVRGLTLGDGFRAVRAMELRTRMRWWHLKTWLVHRLQWLLTFTILHDPMLHMITLPSLQRFGIQ